MSGFSGRKQNSFFRDMTFHLNRREFGINIPATDIDFLEYDNFKPIDLREFKSHKSQWRNGKRTASIITTYKLARMADIPFYIIEHNEDFSKITVCLVNDIKNGIPIVSEQVMTLPEYILSLYKVRNREMPELIRIPNKLTPITPFHLIFYLFQELNKNERLELIELLSAMQKAIKE